MTPQELEQYLTDTTTTDERELYLEICDDIGPDRLLQLWALLDSSGPESFLECVEDRVRLEHPEHFC